MKYQVLYHNDFDKKMLEEGFPKIVHQLESGDFKSADVRKMNGTGYYRARLNIRDRLLFSLVKYQGQKHLLLLELIRDHNYARSRFLRGAAIPDDDSLCLLADPEAAVNGNVPELVYLNPNSPSIHLLNKFISFDEIQQSILSQHAPLIIIGAAGSGKTALVLEKLKSLPGNVAYISLSGFLVENASRLYYSNGYVNENQEVEFLSLSDYLASWEKPAGKEIHFRAFEPWFARHSQSLSIAEPYRVYEEFKGVITGSVTDKAWLTKEEYFALGKKQSIFSMEDREKLYPLFHKYLQFLRENNWYDSNILCYEYLQKVRPRYDYIMVDEVQDITNIQLKCILQALSGKTNFILTGDSNQIVHPNFFSWSRLKTYFHQTGDAGKHVRILQTNYRNSRAVVRLSNMLLKIRNSRFGSIDRESNYLVNTISVEEGEVLLYGDEDKRKIEFNRRTQDSTLYAVIVPDNAYKDDARRFFKTPLVFSIQEAKGLEYENVILVNFVSRHESEFREIIYGVGPEDLEREELQYNRASNKDDKDAEIYKFYINSLYVALTRAVKNVYLFEKLVNHPALYLLQLQENNKEIRIIEKKSSRDEWLEEARRLEEQGKHEQAEKIRAKYLGYEYISAEQLSSIIELALDPSKKEQEVKKERKQLFQYALNHQRYDWIGQLAKLQFQRAVLLMTEVRQYRKEFAKNIRMGRRADALNTIRKFGLEFVTEEGTTGLMLALHHGQHELASELLKQNASTRFTDHKGWLAIDYMLQGFYKNVLLKHNQMATLQTLSQFWHLAKPSGIVADFEKLQLHVGSNSMLFFLIMTMRTMQETQPRKARMSWPNTDRPQLTAGVFDMDDVEKFAGVLPDEILPQYRKNRAYINSVLAANEIGRLGFPGCKMIFKRVNRGTYILNPDIKWT